MATTVINGKELVVDDEGFMTQYDEWDENIGQELATAIGVDMTDDHWKVIRFLR
jgi:Dissimilatory sulfite reductase (desulfoviridin), gamma subunit